MAMIRDGCGWEGQYIEGWDRMPSAVVARRHHLAVAVRALGAYIAAGRFGGPT